MEIHDSNKNEVAWTSWLPALGYAIEKTEGIILELGVGHFSTPFLHSISEAGREVYSVEGDLDWYNQFKHFHSGNHRIVHAPCHRMHPDASFIFFGVVFIDNSPGGEARSAPFKAFLPTCDYVVVHDYHRENEEAIAPILKEMGASFKVFNDYQPPTLLASVRHTI